MLPDPEAYADDVRRVSTFLRWFVPPRSTTPVGTVGKSDVLAAARAAAAEAGLFASALATAGIWLDRMPHPVTWWGVSLWVAARFIVALLVMKNNEPTAELIEGIEPFPLPPPEAFAARVKLAESHDFTATVNGNVYDCQIRRDAPGVDEVFTFDVGAGSKTAPLPPGAFDEIRDTVWQACKDAWAVWIAGHNWNVIPPLPIGPKPQCPQNP
jgi:hypothetical protein